MKILCSGNPSHATVASAIQRKFPTAKQFTAWLRLAPNNKISGGKVLSHHIPKGSSRLKIAFRNTANAIGNLKEGWLVEFFKRINYKKGSIFQCKRQKTANHNNNGYLKNNKRKFISCRNKR
jgi:transposase